MEIRMRLRLVAVGVVAGFAAAGVPAAALAAPPAPPGLRGSQAHSSPQAGPPAATTGLVVGLRPGTDGGLPAARVSAAGVDVLSAERVGGLAAVSLDVPATDAAEAVATLRADPAVRYVEPIRRRSAFAVTADDPYRSQQWGLDRAGLPGAWQRTTGSGTVTVAVLDTGVNEVADLTGALLPGRDYVRDLDDSAVDDNGHGTSVAAIIAGRGNDATGIAGVCWSCRILPVKVLDGAGFGDDGVIAAGIYHAASAGADIINLSLGGPWDSLVLRDAVAYATDAGALVVAAAGNDGGSVANYPAALPGVLAVGASDASDSRYPWSSHGASWVDVAAPGCGLAPAGNGGMRVFCGTSGAAPLVAGVAALVMAQDPSATPAEVAAVLTSTADPAGGWTAAGRVNAMAAVQARTPAGDDPPTVSFLGPAAGTVVRGTIAVTVDASDADGVAAVELLANGEVVKADSSAPYEFTVDTTALARHSQLTAVARDGGSAVASTGLSLVVDNTGPTVTVTSPAHVQRVRGAVTVRATASDASGVDRVELLVGGQVVATDATSPYAPVWDSAGVNGQRTLILRTYDTLGNLRLTYRTVVADQVAPSVSITSAPRSGARVSGLVTVRVAAADAYGIGRVELLINGKAARRDAVAPHRFRLSVAKWPRTMQIQARAYDRAGNVRSTATRTWRRR
jgi:subtilisin family serine protease